MDTFLSRFSKAIRYAGLQHMQQDVLSRIILSLHHTKALLDATNNFSRVGLVWIGSVPKLQQ
ncbi:unnamed protein product [Orchesella dallaii]|uniref:Uncharacterized protein n=1 Tax=Orchesella dallaii TaxID=48710 RepID=A0ABP1S200_9HEXA